MAVSAMAIIAIVALLASIAGGVTSDVMNAKAVQATNSANQALANQTNAFNRQSQLISQQFDADQATIANERNVYNAQHQYQWAVEDLKKAGLNPALAMVQGGASVNSASAASSSPVSGTRATMEAPSFKATAGALAQANMICSALALRAYGGSTSRPIGFGR